jgi:hypothetical protein
MKFNPLQHLRMAKLLDEKAAKNQDPNSRDKQFAMANLFRLLAQKSYFRKPDAYARDV